MPANDEHLKAGTSKVWNWHPDLPVAVTPLFAWPPRPLATVKWFATNWLPMTESPDLCGYGLGYMGVAGTRR